ncbi:MAG TPA: class II aldolase/adducin family protein [Candidatus Sumerlaeota bacterium]|nr:class II aldolase/adducin family protein [Candidatus Sumerlaeota bacterium]HPS01040.1 class II aldolase/adducin family protein [Candidatus Sumerlaeota bacterium]
MRDLIEKYVSKMVRAGLASADAPLFGGVDADLVWNRSDARCADLEAVIQGLSVNSLLFCRPAEPYASIVEFLARQALDEAGDGPAAIQPQDCETRTFLHDLPVIREFSVPDIIQNLKRRKTVIIPGEGIVTWGTVSPEQAYIFFSSACFACFVKFFTQYLKDYREACLVPEQLVVFEKAMGALNSVVQPRGGALPDLMTGPFENEEAVYAAITQAGRATVDYQLVDSFFGNVSYLYNNTLYISQTTSSLEELEGCIDPCPLDGSSCAALTASSEFTAHREILRRTGKRAVLHGHPKFTVILSMDCDRLDCPMRGQCMVRCPEKRFIGDIPIVPGEVGTGPWGLANTLPPAMEGRRGGIVYGHGLFTVGQEDFREAFANLFEIETSCQAMYLKLVGC